jgi:transcriptional regulator with XRE-family HTH domain
MTPVDFSEQTLAQLQASTGVSQGRWSRYLRGRQAMTLTTLEKIAERLGMDSNELLQGIQLRNKKYPQGKRRGRTA